jgi:PAS domain S-box-containing protein
MLGTIGVLIALLLLTLLTQYREMLTARRTAAVLDNAMPSVATVASARGEFARLRTCVDRLAWYHECDAETLERDSADLDADMAHYFALPSFLGESALQSSARQQLAIVHEQIERITAAVRQGSDGPTVLAPLSRQLGPDGAAFDLALGRLITFNVGQAEAQAARIRSSRRAAVLTGSVLSVFAGVMAIWILALVMRSLARASAMAAKIAVASTTDFRALVDSVRGYAIFLVDPTGKITSWNHGGEVILGYAAADVIDRDFSCLYSVESRDACARHLLEAETEGAYHAEVWCVRKDGSRFAADTLLTALRDPDGTRRGSIHVMHDLTSTKRAAEGARTNAMAEASTRARDEFVATLGHELRNPLAAIVTALEVMKLKGSNGAGPEAEIITRQAQHLTTMVDDLLDVSRIATQKIELSTQPVDVSAMIAAALETAGPLLEQRHHHCEVTVPPGLFVDGDEARLQQVVSNLLSNAAKYTEPGGHIAVCAYREDDEVVIEVEDDGIGIEPGLLPHIFGLFVQGSSAPSSRIGGLGIGLNIVKNLVTMHGGSVSAESDGPGKGSVFSVRLRRPAQLARSRASTPPPRPRAASMTGRVLIVDDNEDALFMMRELLEVLGYEVLAFPNGTAALKEVAAFKPDLAILDVGLPDMTGYELGQRIRADLGAAAPKLVALTGYGQATDRAKSKEAGFDLHLVKPIDMARLLSTLESAAPSRPSDAPATPA